VLRVEEDEVVERFLAQRAVEPLDVRRGIGDAVGDGDTLNAHEQKGHEKAHGAAILPQPECSRFPVRMRFSRITATAA
jgi:hypothetical protein